MCYYAPVIALTRSHTRTGLGQAFLPRSEHSVLCLLFAELKGYVSAALGGSCGYCDITMKRKRKHCHHIKLRELKVHFRIKAFLSKHSVGNRIRRLD